MVSSPTPSRGSPGDLEAWEIALAERVVQDFLATRRPFGALTFEDLVQECVTHWWLKRRHYSKDRGASPATYMRTVLKAKLCDIERRERATKRGGYSKPLSLDMALDPEDEEGPTLADILPDEALAKSPNHLAERLELQSHIKRVLSLLSPRQRRLAEQLGSGASMSEIGRLLGVHRSTLYDELHRIREIFRDERLEEFLR